MHVKMDNSCIYTVGKNEYTKLASLLNWVGDSAIIDGFALLYICYPHHNYDKYIKYIT